MDSQSTSGVLTLSCAYVHSVKGSSRRKQRKKRSLRALQYFTIQCMSLTAPTDTLLLCPLFRGSVQLLQRDSPARNPAIKPSETPSIEDGRLRIRCPCCRWQPKQGDRWSCTCGYAWNTFDTGGVCPECGKTWQQTQCLQCQMWSRHDDWYVWEETQGRK